MRRTLIGVAAVLLSIFFGATVVLAQCATIQDGTILTSVGQTIETGFDAWGYNYQAHIFNGLYCESYHNAAWCQPYADVELEMKWNDAWLSSQDCDGDHLLDRYYGFAGYRGSGAWLTNHQKGTYFDSKGKRQRWGYFVKIVAAPLDATLSAGSWYAADGTQIGPAIWGDFAILERVYNDTGTGEHGIEFLTEYSAGFGRFSPE
jgi:hypothetical protein